MACSQCVLSVSTLSLQSRGFCRATSKSRTRYLIEDEAQCPYVALRGVVLALENLNRHVEGSSHYSLILQSLVGELFTETEIADFINPIVDQNVLWLQVSE